MNKLIYYFVAQISFLFFFNTHFFFVLLVRRYLIKSLYVKHFDKNNTENTMINLSVGTAIDLIHKYSMYM